MFKYKLIQSWEGYKGKCFTDIYLRRQVLEAKFRFSYYGLILPELIREGRRGLGRGSEGLDRIFHRNGYELTDTKHRSRTYKDPENSSKRRVATITFPYFVGFNLRVENLLAGIEGETLVVEEMFDLWALDRFFDDGGLLKDVARVSKDEILEKGDLEEAIQDIVGNRAFYMIDPRARIK